jgi:hypothetical protein
VSWTETRPKTMYYIIQYIRVYQGVLYIQNVTFPEGGGDILNGKIWLSAVTKLQIIEPKKLILSN